LCLRRGVRLVPLDHVNLPVAAVHAGHQRRLVTRAAGGPPGVPPGAPGLRGAVLGVLGQDPAGQVGLGPGQRPGRRAVSLDREIGQDALPPAALPRLPGIIGAVLKPRVQGGDQVLVAAGPPVELGPLPPGVGVPPCLALGGDPGLPGPVGGQGGLHDLPLADQGARGPQVAVIDAAAAALTPRPPR